MLKTMESEDYVIVNSSRTVYVNPVERVLKESPQIERGFSLRQLKKVTGLSKKSINYYIYNSKNIENTNPYTHGSHKQRISVFNYTPISKNYFKRNEKRNNLVTDDNLNDLKKLINLN